VHGIWSPYRNLQAMLARLLIRPLFVPAQEERWIYKRGGRIKSADIGSAIRHSWIPAPFHYLNLFLRPSFLGMLTVRDWLSLPQVWYGLIFAVAIDPLREEQPLAGLWLDDLVKDWSPTLRSLFIGLARNGLSARPEEIPLSGFLAFLRFYTLLRRDAWAFSYLPDDGGTSLIEPMVRKLRDLGGTVENGIRLVSVKRHPKGWQLDWQCQGAGEMQQERGSLVTKHLILAVDAPAARTIFEASPDLAAGRLDWPRGMATAVVRFWFDRAPAPGPEAGILSGSVVVDNFFWLHRIQNQYVRWHKATGGSAIEVHIYGPPELLAGTDAVLMLRAISDVHSAFPELRDHAIHRTLRRNDATHTLFGVGSVEQHLGITTSWPGLFCCGDWVRHPAPAFFLERACVTGIEAANAVLRSCQLPPWSLLDYPRPEPLAGSIERLMQGGRRALRRFKSRR
jgi:isorenieratene synthase